MAGTVQIPVIRRKITASTVARQSNVNLLSIIALVFAILVLFVWLKVKTNQLLLEIREMEDQLGKAKIENQKLQAEVVELSSFRRIPKIAQTQLNMDFAGRGDIIKIKKE